MVPNIGNKGRYVLQYKNLQLYLSLGIKLVRAHRILKFKQSHWLKNDWNTDKRKNTANSTFGKTMETLRKRINVRLFNNVEIIKSICGDHQKHRDKK